MVSKKEVNILNMKEELSKIVEKLSSKNLKRLLVFASGLLRNKSQQKKWP